MNQKWIQLSDTLETERALSDSVVIVSDGERKLRAAFVNENSQFQTDVIHGFRILGFKLWEDKELKIDERK